LGLFERFSPKFVKKYARLSEEILKAVQEYRDEVSSGKFPGPEHSFSIKEGELRKIKNG
jgi:3-methyl-2-oxobutanoate hydroxymethyltransferase